VHAEPVENARALKICYLGWGYHVHLERWASYFAKLGHEVTVLSVRGTGKYAQGVRQYRVGFEAGSIRWRRLHLRWLLWRIRPDIVHVHWAHFASLVEGIWNGPLIVTVWGSDIYRLDEFSPADVGLLRRGLRAATVITCDSLDQVRAIRDLTGDPSSRVEVVQWGIDTTLFRRQNGANAFARELGIIGRPVVFSARGFLPVYNLETVVAAFARVRAEVPAAVLVMKSYGGDREYRARVEAEIGALGLDDAVRIVDAVPYERMPELHRLAAVMVSVPFSDGTPMALLEAMACGSVPIVSDLPSLREWIVDGENGYLVDARDVDGLAERLIRVLREPETRKRVAERNADLVRTRASQQTNMGRMNDICRELARQQSA